MERRGHLMRRDVADWLRERLPAVTREAPVGIGDWDVQAKDATGGKAEIPWARVYSVSRSDSATKGWYVVYLFAARGDRVYLSLMQGATRWENTAYPARPVQELHRRAEWARERLAARLAERPDLVTKIDLQARGRKLGPAYENGNVVAFEYVLEDLPSDEVLADDLTFLVGVLGELYEIVDHALDVPGETAPEVVDAEVEAERTAGRERRGLRFSADERRAIERRAVDVATEHLKSEGYRVKDVGATKSYDLDAKRAEEHLYVEVKGTTTTWTEESEIVLTKNEVDLHLEKYPANALMIVSGIVLDRTVSPPTASGGELRVIRPWQVNVPALTPISYRYLVGE
ncbi:protein of unknown function [Lentzea fradiae]|uniref:Uncharacterized protein n=2 Tax=Lentzea fradiae TaxID=200378 RepID=A0A1G7X208_9PSEU|nr:protein of unknown function [Lentzea fradiae]